LLINGLKPLKLITNVSYLMHQSDIATIDSRTIRDVADTIMRLELVPDTFTDPRYYPPTDTDLEHAAAYFTTMVAIDHRTHQKRQYMLEIEGETYRGADLLWRLGKEMFDRDPEFFTAERLANLDYQTLKRWLEPDELELWDLYTRLLLLRDLGRKTLELYSGRFTTLIQLSKGWLYNKGQGFIELLKVYRAYEDPVEKKPFLLVKFLYRRGYLKVVDLESLQVPVDNHVTRIAFRLGIVELSDELKRYIKKKLEVPYTIDVSIRLTVRAAWKLVSLHAKIDPTVLDDYLWNHGRKTCRPDQPKCEQCPLKQACKAYNTGEYLNEHTYSITWYY